jgi:hypothetical protein
MVMGWMRCPARAAHPALAKNRGKWERTEKNKQTGRNNPEKKKEHMGTADRG